MPGTVLPHLTLKTVAGADVSYTAFPDPMALARGKLLVDPESVLGVKHLVLQDTGGTYEETIEIFPNVSMEEALPRIDGVFGGLANVRLYDDGDEVAFLFSMLDEQGRYMPPEPGSCTPRPMARWCSQPQNQMASYTMLGTIRTLPGVEPGAVHVYGIDGRLLGSFPLTTGSEAPLGSSWRHRPSARAA